MKKNKLGPAALFASVLAVVLTSFGFGAQTSAVTEEARTLQMIAPYRSWGKANMQPIVVPLEEMALAG